MLTNEEVRERLRDEGLSQAWQSGGRAPDGDYQTVIKSWEFFESKAGETYVKCVMEIANHPTFNGMELENVYSVDNPARVGWLKKDLDLMLGEVDIADLVDELPKTLDMPLHVTTKTKGEYQNVYINNAMGPPLSELPVDTEDPPPAPKKDKDDAPF